MYVNLSGLVWWLWCEQDDALQTRCVCVCVCAARFCVLVKIKMYKFEILILDSAYQCSLYIAVNYVLI